MQHAYVSDVSEGKNDAIYTSHTYHTKVPYKAIMRYILHYTNPGDIVLDAYAELGWQVSLHIIVEKKKK